jgi:hypothetical protein
MLRTSSEVNDGQNSPPGRGKGWVNTWKVTSKFDPPLTPDRGRYVKFRMNSPAIYGWGNGRRKPFNKGVNALEYLLRSFCSYP